MTPLVGAQARECEGKRRFLSAKHANRRIQRLIARFSDDPRHPTLHAYLCRFCGGWHCGHRTPEAVPRFESINATAKRLLAEREAAIRAQWAARRAHVAEWKR